MGLFSSSKLPQPPLPNIAIHLYSPSEKLFRPDEDVAGHISFTPVAPIAPRALEVSLFGQSLVWHRTSHSTSNGTSSSTDYHHWRDNAPLFEVATNVLPPFETHAPTLDVGETYTFPFSIRFPAGTSNNRSGQYKEDDDTIWTVEPHDLPPSFLDTSKHGTADAPDYAKIEYGVRARLMCPGIGVVQGKNIRDLVVTAPVLFVPLPPVPSYSGEMPVGLPKQMQAFTVQTSALAGQSVNSIGFRQSLRDRFSSSTPKLEFRTIVEIPEVLTTGMEFRFRAAFSVVSKSDNVSHIPAIHFTILNLKLKDITSVRAPRDFEANTMMSGTHRKNKYENMPLPDAPFSGQEHKDVCKQEVHLNSLPGSATLELEEVSSGDKKAMEQASSCEVWFTARVPSFTPPSFRSFAISRNYQVKVTLGVEVGGKKFEQKVKSTLWQIVAGPV